jgi:hypothetical protein
MTEKHVLVNIKTGVLCDTFPTREAAERWLEMYQVSETYKRQNYRIIPIEEWYARRKEGR